MIIKPLHPFLVLALVFLLAMAVRSGPLRFEGSFDPDSHFHARMSNDIARTHQIPEWDALSLQGRVYSYPPLLHVLVGTLSLLSGVDSLIVLKVVGIVIGGLLVVTVFLLAFAISKSHSIALWSGFFAGLSTMAVWRTTGFTRPDGLALMLIPFLLYLWITRHEKLAFLLSLAMVLLHPLSAVIYALLLGIYFVVGLIQKTRVSILIPLALLGMLITFFLWVFSIGLPLSNYASHISLEASELTRFWALGFIVFFPLSWIFNALGIWKGKLSTLLLAWIGVSVVIGTLGMRMATYMIPFLGIAAGYGIDYLIRTYRADKRFLPALGIFMVLLGGVSIYILLDGENPYISQPEHAGIAFLKAQAPPSSSVLTIWDQGHVLAYYTGLPMVIDGYFEFAHELDARNTAMKNALSTSSCETFVQSMDAFHARYFYLPRDELHGASARLGMLALEPCPPIKLLYSSDGVRVYERLSGVTVSS